MKTKSQGWRRSAAGCMGAMAVLLVANVAAAETVAVDDSDFTPSGEGKDSGFLLGAKGGAIFPFNGLSPFVRGGLELGWVFDGGNMAALLDVSYTSPSAEGERTDERLISGENTGTYDWEIDQRELVFQPTFLYRFSMPEPWTPFVGLGPRLYLLETLSRGNANGEAILETTEQSMKFGVGLPFGVEYRLGPGGVIAEGLLEWAPLDHRITGDSSLLAGSLQVGYRAVL